MHPRISENAAMIISHRVSIEVLPLDSFFEFNYPVNHRITNRNLNNC